MALESQGNGRSTAGYATWTGGARVASQLLQFLMSVVLARLLSPGDFGVLAIAASVTSFAAIFTELGINAAVVQRYGVDDDFLSSAFWLNAATGVMCGLLMVAAAYPISLLYGSHSLLLIAALSALQLPLSFGVVQLSLLERQLKFRRVALTELAVSIVGCCVTVWLAYVTRGPESVVLGGLVTTALLSVCWTIEANWLPSFVLTRANLLEIWRFGGNLAKFNVVNYWARNVDNLVLGRLAGTAALGLYSRAYSLMLMPVQLVTVAVSRVMLPTLSRDQYNLPAMRSTYVHALSMTARCLFPICGLLFCSAPNLTVFLYGPAWADAGRVLMILAVCAPLQVVAGTCGPLYQATAQTFKLFRRGMLNSSILVLGILCGCLWGTPTSVAWGYAGAMFVMFYFAVSQPWKFIGLSIRQGLCIVREAFLATVVGAALGMLVPTVANLNCLWMRLFAQSLVFVVVYALVLVFLIRLERHAGKTSLGRG